jgi:hypothetical protein
MKNLRILSHLSLMAAVLLFACSYVYGYNYLRSATSDQAPADSNYGNRYTDQNYPDSNYGDQSSTNSNSSIVNNYPNPYWKSPFYNPYFGDPYWSWSFAPGFYYGDFGFYPYYVNPYYGGYIQGFGHGGMNERRGIWNIRNNNGYGNISGIHSNNHVMTNTVRNITRPTGNNNRSMNRRSSRIQISKSSNKQTPRRTVSSRYSSPSRGYSPQSRSSGGGRSSNGGGGRGSGGGRR